MPAPGLAFCAFQALVVGFMATTVLAVFLVVVFALTSPQGTFAVPVKAVLLVLALPLVGGWHLLVFVLHGEPTLEQILSRPRPPRR